MHSQKLKRKHGSVFILMTPLYRFFAGFLAALLAYLFIRSHNIQPLVQIMILWDIFCIGMLIASWIVFFDSEPLQLRKIASKEDGSRVVVFILVLISSLASMVMVLFLVLAGEEPHRQLYLIAAIAGMLLSWLMVHTTFCFHYAYMYYGDDDQQPEKHAEGLQFPQEKAPDYLDFAYFSFVIGMTFQVSDVNITSRHIRRLALVHGLLSFGLNTFVVALTVNLIAGLKS